MNNKPKNEEERNNAVATIVVPITTAIIGAIGLIIAGIVGGVVINNTIINNYQTPTPVVITATPIATPEITREPSRQFIEQITVPSVLDTGITFTIPQTGDYVFQYAASAVHANSPDTDNPIWVAAFVGFRGNEAQWSDCGINGSVALFQIDSTIRDTKLAAINAVIGQEAIVSLEAGETVTLVYPDGCTDYFDNTGEIIVNIYLVAN